MARRAVWSRATIIPQEFVSPRDFDGHGSHTASTAAGNHNVPAAVNGDSVGNVSGIAPAARLAIYKVCWEVPADRAPPRSPDPRDACATAGSARPAPRRDPAGR